MCSITEGCQLDMKHWSHTSMTAWTPRVPTNPWREIIREWRKNKIILIRYIVIKPSHSFSTLHNRFTLLFLLRWSRALACKNSHHYSVHMYYNTRITYKHFVIKYDRHLQCKMWEPRAKKWYILHKQHLRYLIQVEFIYEVIKYKKLSFAKKH